MMFDFRSSSIFGEGIILFTDFVFADLPKAPADVKETIIIGGTGAAGGVSISITGTADQQE